MEGWVYIASNASMSGLIKIGYTAREPHERLAELSSSTAVPTCFKLEYAEHVENCRAVEQAIHLHIGFLRNVKEREFFRISPRRAIAVVARVAAPLRTQHGRQIAEKWIETNGDPLRLPKGNGGGTGRQETRPYFCQNCGRKYRIPRTGSRQTIECPKCEYRAVVRRVPSRE